MHEHIDKQGDVDPKAYWPVCDTCYARVNPDDDMRYHMMTSDCRDARARKMSEATMPLYLRQVRDIINRVA